MNNSVSTGMSYDGMVYNGDNYMEGETVTETSTGFNMNHLLSNWFFVGGVSGAVLAVSIVFGLLLAKHKIKKGFDVYED